MQKEIKKIIATKLYCKANNREWQKLINEYYSKVKETAKGILIKYRFFEKKDYWFCIKELQKVRFYSEKDNFYRLINEVINDIALMASYRKLLNPYEFEI